MPRHRAVIIGAGRIGACFNWDQDPGYSHAGAYKALAGRVELVGFVEPDMVRANAAFDKWGVLGYASVEAAVDACRPDIVSVCTRDDDHAKTLAEVMRCGADIKGIWMEKPFDYAGDIPRGFPPIQVNYQRRADRTHQAWAMSKPERLVVYGKDNETTRCHFRDLARWFKVPLDYRPFDGPCAYVINNTFFDNGGVNSAECFKAMLGNLIDHIDGGAPLWSPPYND